MQTLLILGSSPHAPAAAAWPKATFDHILTINNAWRIRPDWDACIFPWDFPPDRHPTPAPGQRLVTEQDFVPMQNSLGGFVYAGWALGTHAPGVIAMFGCDMTYPKRGATAFYGASSPDPLRDDITLRSLEGKSARLMVLAAQRGTAMVNLSDKPSRLIFPRATRAQLSSCRPLPFDPVATAEAQALESSLGYHVASGRYWDDVTRFDTAEIDALDALWLRAATPRVMARIMARKSR
jgi:hypothetical protein